MANQASEMPESKIDGPVPEVLQHRPRGGPSRKRRRGSGSIFKKPGCSTWTIQFYKDGRRIREARLTDYGAAQRRLTIRLYEIDKTEFMQRERRPVRIEELFASVEENNLSNGRGRPRDLRGRWRNRRAAKRGWRDSTSTICGGRLLATCAAGMSRRRSRWRSEDGRRRPFSTVTRSWTIRT